MSEDPRQLTPRQKKVIFRSWHRGTREMDLLMGRFADAHVPDMSESELDSYEKLLRESDPDLYSWVSGRSDPPAHVGDIVKLMRNFNYAI